MQRGWAAVAEVRVKVLFLTMDNTTDGTWDSLPVKLNHGILETLSDLRFSHMTPVQVRLASELFPQFSDHVV